MEALRNARRRCPLLSTYCMSDDVGGRHPRAFQQEPIDARRDARRPTNRWVEGLAAVLDIREGWISGHLQASETFCAAGLDAQDSETTSSSLKLTNRLRSLAEPSTH